MSRRGRRQSMGIRRGSTRAVGDHLPLRGWRRPVLVGVVVMVTGSFLTLSQAAQAAGDPTIFGQPVSVDTAATVSAATGLDLPRGLAFDGAGDLYIANYSTSAVVVPQTSGTLFGQSVSEHSGAPQCGHWLGRCDRRRLRRGGRPLHRQ